jgi:GMP synthase-like glutamine amidotransferase
MRINIIQHTPNERPGSILEWAHTHQYDIYIYHPVQFGQLPKADETDMLVVMGGPMSANDDIPWIYQERELILQLMKQNVPILGVCFGAQQIVKALGGTVSAAPKEVGWAPVKLESNIIAGLPQQLTVMHWHGEMFTLPAQSQLLFSSKAVRNQGFVLNHRVIGLQFHFELQIDNVRELVINDFNYITGSIFHQSSSEILTHPIPANNKKVMYKILDYLVD